MFFFFPFEIFNREGGHQNTGQNEAGLQNPAPPVQGDLQHGTLAPSEHHPPVRGGGNVSETSHHHGVRRGWGAVRQGIQRGKATRERGQDGVRSDCFRRKSHGKFLVSVGHRDSFRLTV